MDHALKVEVSGDVATLTLNRSRKKNALTLAMWSTLPGLLAEVAADRAAKVLVVRGAGGTFAAGADIGEFETVYATPDRTRAYFDRVGKAMAALAAFEKPTIAMIEGACVGGGLGLALACDLRIAAADAWLALTPAKLGLVYSLPDTRRLVQAVGLSRAKDILFTGRLIAAEEALVIGLVDALYAPEALEAAVAEKTAQIAAASQWTARRAKAIVGLIADGETRDTDETARWLIEAVEGEDFSEGRNAFLSKRKPEFPFR
ncbi:MAG: enoyl-CoA hydratase/isomerase family protein [Phenylobacterium sp.]|uniref:enoyl-CoA hydratase/isomerase family protein n=1 Tax=Phenylobacterium sp. TaxID=1871053 RepID=UPI0025D2BDBA|nr:enoyl-CoA hydratase-related protein [Phenylobacterium sp.]MCA3729322.1 enoyl-CoA hydratase/isomerase family protein [Phenylobacterium sp.]MCA3747050.1 enoyl-CoA hydratase/isomerase family protein [Phenylobacterium sp.]